MFMKECKLLGLFFCNIIPGFLSLLYSSLLYYIFAKIILIHNRQMTNKKILKEILEINAFGEEFRICRNLKYLPLTAYPSYI